MNKTGIAYCDCTWNPQTGCTRISEGCDHCFAFAMAETRLKGIGGYPVDNPFEVVWHPERLEQPKRVKTPKTIFLGSMTDMFHEKTAVHKVLQCFRVMEECPQHQFLMLTKRASNMRYNLFGYKKPDNCWFGITAENQERLNERMPYLLRMGTKNIFVSLEPLLSAIDITPYLPHLRWVIVGAESRPGKRPCDIAWVADILHQCEQYEVPVFYKQGPDDEGVWCKEPYWRGRKWLAMPEGLKR